MEDKNERREYDGPDFYVVDRSIVSHSMTQEEIEESISRRTAEAREGVNELRRQMIIDSLLARGIDPDTIDIDKTIESNEIVKKKH